MSERDPVVIVSAARTPMGGFMGDLAALSASMLGAAAISGALERGGVEPDAVSEIVMGCVLAAGQGRRPRGRRRSPPACRWGRGRPRSTRCAARA